ncbi:MAG: SDR family oxidoreductase, partial [Myxococcota bacterium]
MTAQRHLRHDGPFIPSSLTARAHPNDVDVDGLAALSPLDALAGKHILLLGTTGFLAKIVLAMLLERFSVGRIYCAIRGTRSKTPEDRESLQQHGQHDLGEKTRGAEQQDMFPRERI